MDFLRGIRHGIRLLARDPAFTGAALLVLTLGIGANTAIFSVVNALLFRPLAYRNPERLVMVWGKKQRQDLRQIRASPPDVSDWKSQNRIFEQMAVFVDQSFNLTGSGDPERLLG